MTRRPLLCAGVLVGNTLGLAGLVALKAIDCGERLAQAADTTLVTLFPSRPGRRA